MRYWPRSRKRALRKLQTTFRKRLREVKKGTLTRTEEQVDALEKILEVIDEALQGN